MAMLFTTHDLGVVRYIADRVAVMYLGKIVEIAPSETFFRGHPSSLFADAARLRPVAQSGRRTCGIASPGVQGEPPSPIDPPSGCRFRTRCRAFPCAVRTRGATAAYDRRRITRPPATWINSKAEGQTRNLFRSEPAKAMLACLKRWEDRR